MSNFHRIAARAGCALLLAGATLGARAAAPVPDTLAQRVLACASCHSLKERNDQFFPRISGKPAGYLFNQLRNFRDGRRTYPMMGYMVEHMPDAYLREIAEYFAADHSLAPLPAQNVDAAPELLARGRVLATLGEPARKVPACIACHGEQLTGVLPAIPGLLGLPRDYINAQFGAWRNQVRQAGAPDCMAEVATRLSAADVNAVSSWLASQPSVAGARPAPSIARPLPIHCGSSPD